MSYKLLIGLWLLTVLCFLAVTHSFAQTPTSDSTESSEKADTNAVTPDSTANQNPEQVIEMSDIHDIKPPEKIGFDLTPLYYLLIGVLILAVLVAIFLLFKRRKKKIKQQHIITLSPDELALNLLEKLSDVEHKEGKAFYFELSGILRNYLQGRFGINAPEMTTEELVPKLEDLEINKEFQQPLRSLLYSADPVKFAGIPAVQSKMEKDLFFVIDFVKKTKSESDFYLRRARRYPGGVQGCALCPKAQLWTPKSKKR